jgi:anti-sigma factor RsiW
MECEKCADDLTAYIDDELSDSRAGEIDFHLRGCRACAEEYRSLKASAGFVSSHIREIQPSEAIWEGLHARLLSKQGHLPAAGWWHGLAFGGVRTWAVTAAAASVMIAGLLGYYRYEAFRKNGELVQYMSSYIQAREQQEQVRNSSVAAPQSDQPSPDSSPATNVFTLHTEYEDNPFVVLESDSFSSNPFR